MYVFLKNEDMKKLDEFLDFYEWCILTSGDKYNLYDLQTNVYIENDDFEEEQEEENYDFTLEEIIDRIVGRALDYELNEHEFEDYIEKEVESYKAIVVECLLGGII